MLSVRRHRRSPAGAGPAKGRLRGVDAAHKESPPKPHANLDRIPYEEDCCLGCGRDPFVRRTGRRVIDAEVRMVASRPDEDRDLVRAETHGQRHENWRLLRMLDRGTITRLAPGRARQHGRSLRRNADLESLDLSRSTINLPLLGPRF